MLSVFLIPFRESLEASVVVGLLFSVLYAYDAKKSQYYVWFGVKAGIVCSLLFAWAFNSFLGGFSGPTEKIYEGLLMFFACGLITHMVFWMKSVSKGLRQKMEQKVEHILQKNTLYMLSFIAFAAVVREGVETVIFFQALEISLADSASLFWALAGVFSALVLSVLVFRGSLWFSTQKVFQISGVLLLFIAGGLLAHGIVELQGAGVLPTFIKPVFDFSGVLSEEHGFGALLKALFGYDANPSLLAIVAYVLFLPVSIWQYTKKRYN